MNYKEELRFWFKINFIQNKNYRPFIMNMEDYMKMIKVYNKDQKVYPRNMILSVVLLGNKIQ